MGLNPDDAIDDPTPTDRQQQQPPQTVESLQGMLQEVRKEAARYRTQNRDLRKLMGALTGEEPPEGAAPPDLNTLKQRFEKVGADHKAEVRSLKLRNGLQAASHKHGMDDPDYLEFHLTKSGSLKDLDVDAASFADDLDLAVDELLANRPELRGGRPGGFAPITGMEIRGGEPPSAQLTRTDLAFMSEEEVDNARRRGLLDSLLGRR
jgi:hypothetical protein